MKVLDDSLTSFKWITILEFRPMSNPSQTTHSHWAITISLSVAQLTTTSVRLANILEYSPNELRVGGEGEGEATSVLL